MKRLMLLGGMLVFNIFISCQSNSTKEPSQEPYPGYDTTQKARRINTPNPDSVKNIGSPSDDQHVK